MIVHVPRVLDAEQVARCREVMDRAKWVDGRVTAGYQSAAVKIIASCRRTAPRRGSWAT